jgi:hypothetical protein
MRGLSHDDGDAMRSCATWQPPAASLPMLRVLHVEEPSPGVFWIVCWCELPAHRSTITCRALFRAAARHGFVAWSAWTPQDALDRNNLPNTCAWRGANRGWPYAA